MSVDAQRLMDVCGYIHIGMLFFHSLDEITKILIFYV